MSDEFNCTSCGSKTHDALGCDPDPQPAQVSPPLVGTRRLTVEFILPVVSEGNESWLDMRPTSITASGLTPEEAEGLAEGWGQSDIYSIDVVCGILNALDQVAPNLEAAQVSAEGAEARPIVSDIVPWREQYPTWRERLQWIKEALSRG